VRRPKTYTGLTDSMFPTAMVTLVTLQRGCQCQPVHRVTVYARQVDVSNLSADVTQAESDRRELPHEIEYMIR
jgi:hypothetical protein